MGLLLSCRNLDEGIRAMTEKKMVELEPPQEGLTTLKSLVSGANAGIERLADELAEYRGYAVRDMIPEKIKSIQSEKSMLLAEREKLTIELEYIDVLPDLEGQIEKPPQRSGQKSREQQARTKGRCWTRWFAGTISLRSRAGRCSQDFLRHTLLGR